MPCEQLRLACLVVLVGGEVQLLDPEFWLDWSASNLICEALFLCAYGALVLRQLLR